ncbi:MAG: hypothetical protein H7248_00980 [Microbacteriaceae bacterium]|nr:hypothetical protein [Microbacteriaceae bacterium]
MTAPHHTPAARPSAGELTDPLEYIPPAPDATASEPDSDDSSTGVGDSERSMRQNQNNALRYRGILIAAAATLFLWAVVGLTLWGALSIFP